MDAKALRQKILDLAIRGKLVPQDPNDEPASVLLERIREQKKQMVKDGKLKPKDIKKDTVIFKGDDNLHYEKFPDGSVKCIEDEIPFNLPEGWEWARLKHICMMVAGKPKPSEQIKHTPFEGSYPCFGGNGIRGYVDEYNRDGTFSIVGRQGALCGNINVASGKFYATEHAVITTIFTGIDFDWCNYILEALQLNKYATGAAQPGLSVANILNVFVPVPPLNEQVIIGAKVSESIKLIDIIEHEKASLQEIANKIKSKILDLAIRGKLVPQDPNDEPASVLLERIRAEKEELIKQGKIKRNKKESVIFKGDDNSYYESIGEETTNIDDEIPFELPQNWEWSRLQTICYPITDGTHKTPTYSDTGYIFLSAKNITTGKINWNDVMYIPKSLHDELYSRISPQINDILLAKNGTTGVAAIVDRECEFDIYVTLALLRVISNNDILPQYLLKILASNTIQDYFNSSLKGIGVPNLHLEHIRTTLIPIPPINEQKRISKKVDQLFFLLDSIAKNAN